MSGQDIDVVNMKNKIYAQVDDYDPYNPDGTLKEDPPKFSIGDKVRMHHEYDIFMRMHEITHESIAECIGYGANFNLIQVRYLDEHIRSICIELQGRDYLVLHPDDFELAE